MYTPEYVYIVLERFSARLSYSVEPVVAAETQHSSQNENSALKNRANNNRRNPGMTPFVSPTSAV